MKFIFFDLYLKIKRICIKKDKFFQHMHLFLETYDKKVHFFLINIKNEKMKK